MHIHFARQQQRQNTRMVFDRYSTNPNTTLNLPTVCWIYLLGPLPGITSSCHPAVIPTTLIRWKHDRVLVTFDILALKPLLRRNHLHCFPPAYSQTHSNPRRHNSNIDRSYVNVNHTLSRRQQLRLFVTYTYIMHTSHKLWRIPSTTIKGSSGGGINNCLPPYIQAQRTISH